MIKEVHPLEVWKGKHNYRSSVKRRRNILAEEKCNTKE
jgi:hypothetical protein